MINWFIKQSKTIKIGIFAVLIILFFAIKSAYWKHQYSKGLELQIKELVSQNTTLKKDINAIDFERKMLESAVEDKSRQLNYYIEQAKLKKDETDKIPDIVRTYPDSKLDDKLSNHRHIKGTEN